MDPPLEVADPYKRNPASSIQVIHLEANAVDGSVSTLVLPNVNREEGHRIMVLVNALGLAEHFQPGGEWAAKEGALHRRNPWVSRLKPAILPGRFSAQDSQRPCKIRLAATREWRPGHRFRET